MSKRTARKRIVYFDDHYVGEEVLRKADSMTDENTEYKWSYREAYVDIYKNIGGIARYTKKHEEIIAEYERLGLDYITGKEQLKEKLSHNNPDFWKEHDLNQYWEEYLQRDKLIRAGLYEQARQEIFTENYLNTAAQYMGSDDAFKEIKHNLGKLTPKQFSTLVRPSPDRDKTTTALPPIAELYQLKGMKAGTSAYEDLLSRFITAFKEAGLKWDMVVEKQEPETNIDRIHVTVKEFIKEIKNPTLVNDKYTRAFRSQFFFTTTAQKEAIIAKGYDLSDTFKAREAVLDLLHERELRLQKQGKSLVKISKKGNYYIRGVSRAVTADYIDNYYEK